MMNEVIRRFCPNKDLNYCLDIEQLKIEKFDLEMIKAEYLSESQEEYVKDREKCS